MSLLIFGTTSFDTIETPCGTATRVLGGSAMHACFAASHFTPTRLVSIVGNDFPDDWRWELQTRDVDLRGLPTCELVKTQFWRGRYHDNWHDREHLEVDLDVFEHFDPVLPDEYRTSEYVLLGQHDPMFQLRVLQQLQRPKWVMVDTIDYWIINRRTVLNRVLERVDGLFVNDAEARLLSGEFNLVRAAQRLLTFGPKCVIVKKGEHGAMLATNDELFLLPAFPVADLVDPTGAGDAFAGAMMGYLSRHPNEIRRAMAMGSVVASFAVEGFGLERLKTITRLTTDERMSEYDAMRFVG